MTDNRRRIVEWVAAEVLPHEAVVRAWLRGAFSDAAEIDDVMQEAYCRLSMLSDVDHITNPRAYLFQTARNVVLEQLRRARIVRIDALTELETANVMDDEPSPERIVAGRGELARVKALIADLPSRCRTIIELRKIDGLSQRDIAQRLGVSENVVENDAKRGLRHILEAMAQDQARPDHRRKPNRNERTAHERYR
ncbi:RNA polymerase sigma factor [Caulobacter sp. NIBR2454]|uniref:RNA polymerase sigma factor n=1 Tax=Caulobacter sp. NIBR2454 TaxID=3015996 RepID=UPI0022B6FCCF|nr:RNA polymerase sigma factor [Caulobacter sp. NIBR2454]